MYAIMAVGPNGGAQRLMPPLAIATAIGPADLPPMAVTSGTAAIIVYAVTRGAERHCGLSAANN